MTQGLYFGTLLPKAEEVFIGISPLPAPSSHSSSLWHGWVGLGGAVSLLIPQTRSEPWAGCGAGPRQLSPLPSPIPGAFGVCGAGWGSCVPWIPEHSPALGPSSGSKWAFLVLLPPVAAEASWTWWLLGRARLCGGGWGTSRLPCGVVLFSLFFLFVLLSFFSDFSLPFVL